MLFGSDGAFLVRMSAVCWCVFVLLRLFLSMDVLKFTHHLGYDEFITKKEVLL